MSDKVASTDQPDIAKRIAEVVVNDWVTKAARARIKRKADAISEAACTLADLLNREVSQNEMIAAALRETIKQCQTSQGFVFVAEVLCVIRQLEAEGEKNNFGGGAR